MVNIPWSIVEIYDRFTAFVDVVFYIPTLINSPMHFNLELVKPYQEITPKIFWKGLMAVAQKICTEIQAPIFRSKTQ